MISIRISLDKMEGKRKRNNYNDFIIFFLCSFTGIGEGVQILGPFRRQLIVHSLKR